MNSGNQGGRRAVFLDRDGVLNEPVIRDGKPYPPDSLEALKIYPDVPAALQRLKDANYVLVVVTNQPDVARGTQTRENVDALNSVLAAALPLDRFYVCWHDDADDCPCRKPKPGLLVEAAAECGVNLSRSFMIGDRWRDIEAGSGAGCRTVFIDRSYREKRPTAPDFVASSLVEAVDWLMSTGEGPR